MTMTATILNVNSNSLLVRDSSNNQEVLVFYTSENLRPDDKVKITYNGLMTRSFPPQITADYIQRIGSPVPVTSQMWGIVLQVFKDYFTVWDYTENRVVQVDFPGANRRGLRTGLPVTITYDSISFDDPPFVTAVNVTPTQPLAPSRPPQRPQRPGRPPQRPRPNRPGQSPQPATPLR
ncbi:MAG: hypothetical protein LBR74_02430, partial [Eubacterium sp.]|nr:hypothetical protein [Eubacterium sp.]